MRKFTIFFCSIHFHLLAALAMLAVLGGCHLAPEERAAVIRHTVSTVDTNGDGIVTQDELEGAPQKVDLWVALLLALGGVGGGAALGSRQKKAQS